VRLHNKHKETPFKAHVGLKVSMDETYKISELSKTAMRLYLFIREYSFRTDGKVVFDFAVAKALCNFKQDKSVYNALNELIRKDIIACSEDSIEYYYNPRYIGNEKE
jgi:regulatory protein YycI of two-component signal transduction system YycFG